MANAFLQEVMENPQKAAVDYIASRRQRNTNTYNDKQGTVSYASEYMTKNGISITNFAETIGVSRPLLSQYLNGKYASDTTELEEKILEYLKSVGFIKELPEGRIKLPDFYRTNDALGVLGVCQSSQEHRGLGVIVGKSGYGKTFTLKQFARTGRVCYIECDDSMNNKDFMEAIEISVGIPGGLTSIWKRSEGVKDFFSVNRGYVLVIDEADKLISKYTQKKMETLRAIFDQSSVGIVLAGEPALEAKLRNYLPRLANRVDFYYNMRGISKKEVFDYLSPYNFTPEAIEEMYRRAANVQTGCFRLLDRTMRNISRIIKAGDEITIDIISEASNMMML